MTTLSHQFNGWIPALISVLLVFLSATPLQGGAISYTPNVVFLMTLLLAGSARFYWPRGLIFVLGLLQDVLLGTPLGAQALLALLLAQWLMIKQARGATPLLFRVQWLEAFMTFLVLHMTLWVLIELSSHQAPPLSGLLVAGVVNAAWYPLFYRLFRREAAA